MAVTSTIQLCDSFRVRVQSRETITRKVMYLHRNSTHELRVIIAAYAVLKVSRAVRDDEDTLPAAESYRTPVSQAQCSCIDER